MQGSVGADPLARAILLLGLTGALLAAPVPAHAGSSPNKDDLLRSVGPVIVQVRPGGGPGTSTGIVIDPTGVVVTSAQALEASTAVVIRLASGEEFEDVKILGIDLKRDLILLKFAGFGIPVASFANSDEVTPGQAIFAIGYAPEGTAHATKGTVTAVEVTEAGVKVIRTDAPSFPGAAGGPLVNQRGEVVGIARFDAAPANLVTACPANNAKGLLSHQTPVRLADLPGGPSPGSALAPAAAPAPAHEPQAPPPPATGLAGRWTSSEGGAAIVLREADGAVLGDSRSPDGLSVLYELRPQPDGTVTGKARTTGSCSYFNPYKGWSGKEIEKGCLFDTAMVITLVTRDRVEGRIEARDPPKDKGTGAYRHWCDTCGGSVKPRWVDFTWVRVE